VITYNATEQIAAQDPQGNVTGYGYDAAGRVIQVSSPVTGTAQYTYDAVGNTMAVTTSDRGSGAVTTLEALGYDALNRVITSTVVTNTANVAGSALTTLTRYDQDGNVAQTVRPNGDVIYDVYDAADRLTSVEIDPAPLSKQQAATHATYEAYGYDAAGNVATFADSDGRTTVAQHDGADRVIQGVDTSSGLGGTTVITTAVGYDPDGNTVNATTATQKPTGAVETHTTTRTYNAADWQTGMSDDGQITSYSYDAAGQTRGETSGDGLTSATAGYDPEGRVTSIGENAGGTGPYTSQFAYNANDLRTGVTLPGSVSEAAGYDPNNELTSLVTAGPNMGAITNTLGTTYAYAYSAAGWTTSTTTISGTDTLTHDGTGRLTADCGLQSEVRNTGDHCYRWTYDPNGNVTSQVSDNGGTQVYTNSTTQPNERVQATVLQATVPVTDRYKNPDTYYAYDNNGNTTAITSPVNGTYTDPAAVNTHIAYDAEDRPITVTHLSKAVPITATLGYNADGLRDRYTVVMSGTAIMDERFSYRDGQIAQVSAVTATLNGDGSVRSSGTYKDTFIYGPSGGPLEFLRQQNGATNRYWYVLDGQGSVVAVTDVNGKVVDRYNYDSWGETIGKDYETVPQQVRYAGYWWDGELEWSWLTTRYYDPEDLRFLQPDPSDLDGVHTYVYASDDPADYVDPSGLSSGGSQGGQGQVGKQIIDRLIQGVRDRWPNIVTKSPWAPGKQWPGYYIGNSAHKEIGAYYAEAHGGEDVFLNQISIGKILRTGLFPNVNADALSKTQLGLEPDILNATRREIYEIKSTNYYGVGVIQRDLYISLFHKAGVMIKPGPTADPGVNGILTAPGGYFVFVSPTSGIIIYRKFAGDYKPRAATDTGSASATAAAAAVAAIAGAIGAAAGLLGGGSPVPSPIGVPLPAA